MNRFLLYISIVCLSFCSCNNQNNSSKFTKSNNHSEYFFGNIKTGAKLEECISTGWVKSAVRANEYRLSSEIFNGCEFNTSAVLFDKNNIIEKVELTYHYNFFPMMGHEDEKDMSNQYFNKMMQYCCSHFGNMTSNKLSITDDLGTMEGTVNEWSTQSLNIRLKNYRRECFINQDENSLNLNSRFYDGNYVIFIIESK